eukprot:352443-Chlamydomonas_euryale.AAC.10
MAQRTGMHRTVQTWPAAALTTGGPTPGASRRPFTGSSVTGRRHCLRATRHPPAPRSAPAVPPAMHRRRRRRHRRRRPQTARLAPGLRGRRSGEAGMRSAATRGSAPGWPR